MTTAQVASASAPACGNVHLLAVAFENAPAHMRNRTLIQLGLPWLGLLDVERRGAPALVKGIKWFAADAAEGLPTQLQVGGFRATFYPEPSLRPRRLTVAALALTFANVAGWTEGHLWNLF